VPDVSSCMSVLFSLLLQWGVSIASKLEVDCGVL
jgi:hypothetical protein